MPKKKHVPASAACCTNNACHTAYSANPQTTFGIAILTGALFVILTSLDLLPSASPDTSSFFSIFLVGLLASFSSCLGMVGGLLLAAASRWKQFAVESDSTTTMAPFLSFNIGRLLGYFIFGGITGLLGKSVGLSIEANGLLTIVLGTVMVVIGARILGIFPKRCSLFRPPQFLRATLTRLTDHGSTGAASLLGALTFFVPCGFTQAMQIVALSSGSFLIGSLTMLTFALGTLPMLLGISSIGVSKNTVLQTYLLPAAGTLVLLLGILNIPRGFTLVGAPLPNLLSAPSVRLEATLDPAVTINNDGTQIISLTASQNGYSPNFITIERGRPTWFRITADQVSGCASTIVIPKHKLGTNLVPGENWLGPIQDPEEDFVATCSMGMFRTDIAVRG